jgi:poly-gamma-glutamate synthesis protein (capsule biosynthesis protein)
MSLNSQIDHEGIVEVLLCPDVYPVANIPLDNINADPIFSAIRDSDFSVINFEIPLTERGMPTQKLLSIRTSPTAVDGFSSLKFRVATLANNHAPDYGWEGLMDTRKALEDQLIQVVGLGETLAAALQPVITTVKSKKIGVLAFSCLSPAGAAASSDRSGIACVRILTSYEIDPGYQMEEPGDPGCISIRTRVQSDDLAMVCDVVRKAKESCDYLIASIHWGFGSTEALAEYQPALAEALIDAGADVIHGHHPHAIQAIGFYRDRPIIFSANVLIGQQVFLPASEQVHELWRAMSSEGFIARLTLGDKNDSGIEVIPTVLNEQRLPVSPTPATVDRILERLEKLSVLQGGAVRRMDGRIMVFPAKK